MFFESTISVVFGACGGSHGVARRANMFSSKLVCLQDDMGSEVSDDVSSETYKELFELFTNSGDWVINIQVSSGE